MAEFMLPDGAGETSTAESGRVPKVSETTVVKGLNGQIQSWHTGKKLKTYFFTDEQVFN